MNTLQKAVTRINTNGEAFIVCGLTQDGELELSYRGDLRQLKAMFRHIRDTMKTREKIGNHPNRPQGAARRPRGNS